MVSAELSGASIDSVAHRADAREQPQNNDRRSHSRVSGRGWGRAEAAEEDEWGVTGAEEGGA